MLNEQPIEKVVRHFSGTYDVHSVFETIQGEGPFCGVPAVFVRLAGCQLQCPWCDTDYTQGRYQRSAHELVFDILENLPPSRLVVITGGEPFRQPIGPLLKELVDDHGLHVQVESNGTLPPPPEILFEKSRDLCEDGGAYLVISPKTGKIHPGALEQACCLKYVLAAGEAAQDDGLPLRALGHTANPRLARPPKGWDRPIYLQPADHKDEAVNAANQSEAVASCMTYGYTLQLQIHKTIGVD